MQNLLKTTLTVLAFIPITKGNSYVTNESSICEDWVNYNNEKCLKLMESAGPKTQKEAESACRSLSKNKSFSKLIIVKTRQQYNFLLHFLNKQNISESVWLGLKHNNTSQQFEWNDGSNLVASNLKKPNESGLDYKCVEMNKLGVWVIVSCTKENIAVCEREPIQQAGSLQNVQSDKNATERKQKDYEEKFLKSEEKIDILKEATERTISFLKEIIERINALEKNEETNKAVGSHYYLTGHSDVTERQYSRCGDWTPFKDEKCFKLADNSSQATQGSAEIICKKYADGMHPLAYPRLVTIKTREEQTFLQHFLFDEKKITHNVWLGMKKMRSGKGFEWNDRSKVYFNNWNSQSVSDDQHDCVEMESGRSVNARGTWTRVGCEKTNVVICERTPTWNLDKLQNVFLSMIMEHELQKMDWKKEKSLLKESTTASEREISRLKEENQAYKQDISSLKEINTESKRETEFLKEANETSGKKISRLKQENQACKHDINSLKEINTASKREIEFFKKANETSEIEISRLKEENQARKQDISSLNEINTESKREIEFLKEANETSGEKISRLKQENQACKHDINSLKEINTASKREIEFLKEANETTEREIRRLKELNEAVANLCSLNEPKKTSTSDVINVHPSDHCPKCQPFEDIKKEDSSKVFHKLLKMACEDHDFVWQVEFRRQYVYSTVKNHGVKIQKVLKNGCESAKDLDETMVFFKSLKECECPKMVHGETYVIMGKDGIPYTNLAGETKYLNFFDGTTIIYHSQLIREKHSGEDQELQKSFNSLIKRLSNYGCSR